jgi:MraZ protein
VAALVGTHRYQLDDKGRIPLPVRLREAFAGGGMFTLGYDRCVWAYPAAEYERRAAEFHSLSISDEGSRATSRLFFANSEELSMDKTGRMPVPSRLREKAGIGREVVVVGAYDRLEIWDRAEWERLEAEHEPAYLAGTLAPGGRQG